MKVKSLLPAVVGLILTSTSYAATFTVTNNADSGPGSYRQAVLDANALAGADIINFNIGSGAQTIALLSVVDITTEIFVDGTTQPGYAGTPLISFTGTSMFRVNGGSNSTIQALNISGDTGGPGVYLINCSGVTVQDCDLSGNLYALRADGNNSNVQFVNNNGSNATSNALFLAGGTNNGWTITGNNLTNAGAWGIHHVSGTPTAIDGNDVSGSRYGIYILGSGAFTLSPMGSGGPNENIYANHEQTLYLNACNGMNISNWDFTTTTLAPSNTRTPFLITNCSNITIDNNNLSGMLYAMRADGNNSNIQFTNNNGSNAASNALFLAGGTNNGWNVIGNNLTNAGAWGVHYASGTPTAIDGNDVSDSRYGIYIIGSGAFTLSPMGSGGPNENIYANHEQTLYYNACTGMNVSNWDFTATTLAPNNTRTPFLITNCSNITIDNNNLSGMLYAMRADGNNSNIQFTNNNGSNAASNALFMTGGTNNGWTITGNNLVNAGAWGIHHASGTPTTIDGNDVSGSRYGIYMIGSGAFTLSPMGSGGPNENTYANHEQTVYFNACTGMNVSNWDFTATTLAPNNTRTPFLITNCSNITIDNNNLSGMFYAMRADGNNTSIQFTNNNGAGAASHGLFLTGGTNNGWTITGNDLTNAGAWGIHHASGTPTAIDGNDVSGSRYGIYMIGSGAFTLSPMGSGGPNENIYADHEQTLNFNACTGMNVSNWDFTATTLAPNNTRTPFTITNCSNITIDNNNLSGMLNAMRADGNNTSIQFTNNNGVDAANVGLFLTGGTNNGWTITGNDLSNAGSWGIHYASGTPTDISNNDMSGSVYGLYLLSSGAFTLGTNNYLNTATTGISMNACTSVTINNADVTATGGTGILLTNSNSCNIDGTIACGRQYGIRLSGTCNNNNLTNSLIANSSADGIRLDVGTISNTTIDQSGFYNNINDILDNGTGTSITNTIILPSAPFCPCVNPADQAIAAADASFVCEGATTIDLASSESGVNYYLRDDANGMFIDGPVAGTGSAVSLVTGSISATTDFNVIGVMDGGASDALQIDGVDGYVDCGNDASLDIRGDITVETWIYIDAFVPDWVRIAGKGNGANRTYGLWYNQSGDLLWQMYGPTNINVQANGVMTTGAWHHVAATRSGNAMTLYLNGVAVATGTYTNTPNSTSSPFTFGAADIDHSHHNGAIDEVRVWNIARTQVEIANSMDLCLTGNEPGLVAYYPIEAEVGTSSVFDKTGSNHGVLTLLDPAVSWVTGASICGACEVQMSNLATVNVDPLNDETLAAASSPICPNTATTIDLGSSQNDVFYFLRDDSNDAVIEGPTAGTGSGLGMSTGNLAATTSYNVLATTSLGIETTGGTNAKIEVTGVDVSNQSFSVEFWAKRNATGNNMFVVGQGTTAGNQGLHIGFRSSDVFTFAFFSNDLNTPTTYTDNNWHHYAVTYDATTNDRNIYVDGSVVATDVALADYAGTGTMTLGNVPWTTQSLNGSYDNVRIWNKALSASEVADNMNDCVSGMEEGLLAAYALNDGPGSSSASDLTGNYNGTLTNMDPANDWANGSPGCGCEAEMTTIETVTVQDNAPTVATSPGNLSANVDAGTCAAVVTYTSPTFDDDCDGTGLTGSLSSGLASGSSFPVGVNTVEYTYTDASGQSVTETFTITVTDNEDPVIPTLSTLTDECSVTATAPTTTDNCAGTITGTTTDPLTYSTQGTFTINWNFDDGNGNTITVPQIVTIDDVTPPVFAGMPLDQTILANNAGCTGIATWTAPAATDNCGGAVTITSSHNSGDAFPLGTTTVTYTVTDSEGNTTNASFDITVNSDLGVTNVATIDADCNGAATGSIDITVGGGTAPFTFDWDNDGTGDNDDTEDLTGLAAGTYNGVVTDANGCTDGGSVIINEPTAVVVTIDSQVNPSGCGLADGAASITASGGTIASGYTYLWSDGGTFSDTNEDQIALLAGSYTVIATDDNGCTGQATVNLSDPNGPTVTLNGASVLLTNCFGDTDGSIDIDVVLNGGATSSTFDWDNDGTGDNDDSEDLSGLGAGTYNVEVVDDNNCVATLAVTVSEPTDIVVSAFVTDVTCYGDADGSVDVTASGGTVSGSYLYDWDNDGQGDNDDMEDAMGLGDSTLVLVVTDDNGCTDTTTYTVIEPDSVSGTFVLTHVSCYGLTDGAIDLTATGGDGSYTFLWDDAGASTTEDISGLGTATYTVIITDGNGCVGMVTDSIMQPDSLVLSAVATDELLGSDGTIDLTVMGGTATYVFDWDNDGTGDNDDTEDLSALTAGTYVVVVTDANGCSDSLSVTVGSQVSIGDIETIDVTIYPNPSTGNFSIELSQFTEDAVLRVLSADGRLVQQQTINNVITDVQLPIVERGTYMVQILTSNSILTRSIIIQ